VTRNSVRRLPSPLFSSMAGNVRIGPLMAIPDVLTELGVAPRRAFARAGADLRLFRNPESRIPFEALAQLLTVCADLTGCGHFGLLAGARFRLQALGEIGHLMRNSATVGDALRALLLHLHLHDRGAVPVLLELEPSSVLLGYSAYGQGATSLAQIYDAAIAIGYRSLQELCGPSWSPTCVQFPHVRPADIAAFRRLFQTRLQFDAEACGVVFASSWLEQPISGTDPAMRHMLKRAIARAEEHAAMSFSEQVACALPQLVLNGASSADDVARCFGIHQRTMRKRLRADGTHLQKLVDQARFGLARQLLRDTGLPVLEVAAALRYSDPNVFSRAFRNWAGASPRQWRDRQGGSARAVRRPGLPGQHRKELYGEP
jgi:AraC-like DNA-binding protein